MLYLNKGRTLICSVKDAAQYHGLAEYRASNAADDSAFSQPRPGITFTLPPDRPDYNRDI